MAPESRRRSRRVVRLVLPFLVAGLALLALVLAIDPRGFAQAIRHFDVRTIPLVLLLSLGYYWLQGVRWHPLLRAAGVTIRRRDTQLLNLAGQSTGLLPLGELTRGVLVCETTGAELGDVVATITIQELIYTLLLIAAAVPASYEHPGAAPGVIAALAGTLLVVMILTVPQVFHLVHRVVRRTPLLRRFSADVLDLQRQTVVLLRRWDTFLWASVSVIGALVAISLFWLIVYSISPGALGWKQAAFVYAVSHVAAAITFLPGGLGAYEASVTGLLIASGLPGGEAAAAAILHRCADKGIATVAGMVAYGIARRQMHFEGLRSLRAVASPEDADVAAKAAAG